MAKRRKGNREKEKETTWQERVIQIRRVSKVVKGGKKLSFRAIVVVGNENGQVGVGVGKAGDVIGAVRKGVADGKKQLIEVSLTKASSITHLTRGASGGAQVLMRPAAPGTGVIATSTHRCSGMHHMRRVARGVQATTQSNGAATSAYWRRGRAAPLATRLLMRGCVNSQRPVSCTIALA